MKFVIDDLLFDTEKMEYITDVYRYFRTSIVDGLYRKCKMYKSKKNNFILCYTDISDKIIALRINEVEAKSLLLRNDYDAYAKLYGELEEG